MNQTQLNFDGDTYDPAQDQQRLNTALGRIWLLMRDGRCRTLREIASQAGCSEAGASARLRDLRKPRVQRVYPCADVKKRRGGHGLWVYWLEI